MANKGNSGKKLVAVCGKGGVGKTAFTAILGRTLMDSDRAGKLLLIDADPAMGLLTALGIEVNRTMGQVREEIINTARKGGDEEKEHLINLIDYMSFEALNEFDGYAILAMGRTEAQGCFCPINDLLRGTIENLSGSFDTILIDGEAGLEQINRQVMRHVDILFIVSDATSRGIQTAEMVKHMVQHDKVIQCGEMGLVFNRVQGNEELLGKLASDIGLEVFGYIPQDENVSYFDLVGKPLTELPDTSPCLVEIKRISDEYVLKS